MTLWPSYHGHAGGRARRAALARRGGALAEFALAAPVFLLILISAVEFGIEGFIRQSTERAAVAAAQSYAQARDVSLAEQAARDAVPGFVEGCLAPLEVRLVDTVAGRDFEAATMGRPALGTPADDPAVATRIALRCDAQRRTPLSRAAFGPRLIHDTVSVVRLR